MQGLTRKFKMKFIFHGVVKMKVKNRWRECLSYSTKIDESSQIIPGGLITLDKKWMFCCISPKVAKEQWMKLTYYSELEQYGFPDPDNWRTRPFTVYRELIDMVDLIAIERELL
jgi:hypothetical protein